MPRKKKKTTINPIQVQLNTLTDLKFSLLTDLSNYSSEYNKISSEEVLNENNWVAGFPIESLHTLNKIDRTRLGDLKKKEDLKKKIEKIIVDLEKVDDKLKITNIDLISYKVKNLLEILEK